MGSDKVEVLLTRREELILKGLRDGLVLKEISSDLNVRYNTLKFNLVMLRAKLGAKNSVHAVVIAIRLGLIALRDGGSYL